MTVAFAITVPVLVGVFLSSSLLAGWIIRLESKQKKCVEMALALPAELKPDLKTLLDLNPLAKTMRARRRAAELALATATLAQNPVAIAKAAARLNLVVRGQHSLDIRQRLLVLKMSASASKWLIEARSLPGLTIERWTSAAIQADAPESLAPIYNLKENYEHAQSQWLKWNDRTARGRCAGTLTSDLRPKLLAFEGG